MIEAMLTEKDFKCKIIENDYGIPTKIIDSNGVGWRYSNGKIVADGDNTPGGGYYCSNFEEGIKLLIKYGYIERK